MGIHYKEREIDYEKTMGGLQYGESVIIPTGYNDIANIRAQVHKVSRKLGAAGEFKVSKSPDGAIIARVIPPIEAGVPSQGERP